MKKHHIVWLLSSSTGGHAIPVLELYRGLAGEPGIEPWIIHSDSKIERELFSRTNNIVCKSGKFDRRKPLKNLGELSRFAASAFKTLYLLIAKRPAVVFSKGGFNAVPALFWARFFHIPYFLHESDSIMGASNQYFYKDSVCTFVSFPASGYDLDRSKLIHSGFIVRQLSSADKSDNELPTILVTGGSQGAVAINQIVFELLPQLLPKYRIIHHIGINDEARAKEVTGRLDRESARHYKYFVFSATEMISAIQEADLIISRSGSTIGEISALSKPSILIPYPYAAADHQTKNAKFLEKHSAAIIIKQEQLTAKTLLDRIDFILSDKRNAEVLSANIHLALKTDGAEIILNQLLNFLHKL